MANLEALAAAFKTSIVECEEADTKHAEAELAVKAAEKNYFDAVEKVRAARAALLEAAEQ